MAKAPPTTTTLDTTFFNGVVNSVKTTYPTVTINYNPISVIEELHFIIINVNKNKLKFTASFLKSLFIAIFRYRLQSSVSKSIQLNYITKSDDSYKITCLFL